MCACALYIHRRVNSRINSLSVCSCALRRIHRRVNSLSDSVPYACVCSCPLCIINRRVNSRIDSEAGLLSLAGWPIEIVSRLVPSHPVLVLVREPLVLCPERVLALGRILRRQVSPLDL